MTWRAFLAVSDMDDSHQGQDQLKGGILVAGHGERLRQETCGLCVRHFRLSTGPEQVGMESGSGTDNWRFS